MEQSASGAGQAGHRGDAAVLSGRDLAVEAGGRLAGVEALRVIACCGIVWFHVKAPGWLIGYGGLPAFMVIAVAFAARSRSGTGLREYVLSRFRRMGLPWLFWSAVYALLKGAQVFVGGRPFAAEFRPWMVLTGPSVHLWFLPFAMVTTAAIGYVACCGWMMRGNKALVAYALLGSIVLPLSAFTLERLVACVPFAQWIYITPAIVVGLALATVHTDDQFRVLKCLVVFLSIAGPCVLGWAGKSEGLSIPYVAGVGGCAVAWAVQGRAGTWLSGISRLSFGVYLVHPLVASALSRTAPQCDGTMLALAVCVVSFMLVQAMRLTSCRVFV